MRNYIALLLSVFLFTTPIHASHIKGGWIGYKYEGVGSQLGTSLYTVTVHLYIDCHNHQGYTKSLILGAFDAQTKAKVYSSELLATKPEKLEKTTFSPCLINTPEVCYNVFTYQQEIELPDNDGGYNLNVQFRARVEGIINIYRSEYTGITLFANIPGKITQNNETIDYHTNNSPYFNFLDTSAVCHNAKITIPFSAVDPDGDSLSYRFESGNDAGSNSSGALIQPTPPPYYLLNYVLPYIGTQPMGSKVTIDPVTGLISGIAPDATGEYVVAVYVDEWRKGVLISTSKKELQINVSNCSLQSAVLDPSYINCKNYTFTFQNNTQVNPASKYTWDFGVPTKSDNISNLSNPTFTYSDTGIYQLKLKVGLTEECTDSTTSEIKVYPGFVPGFNEKGSCILSTSNFSDATTTRSGIVNSWKWDFGDQNSSNDQNPNHQYTNAGIYKIILSVGNSKGCSDTVSHTLEILSSVVINPLFTDSTICNKDSVQLLVEAKNAKSFHWTSLDPNIDNADIQNPTVFPKQNTEYTLLAQNGECTGTTKIKVNLLGNLNLIANDVYACIGDSAQFNASTQANNILWTQTSGLDTLDFPKTLQPSLLVSGNNNTYNLLAKYGKHCQVEKNVQVFASPYPKIKILGNKDTTICRGNSLEISTEGTTTDNIWTPSHNTESNIRVSPEQTTNYIINGYDRNSYCSKHAYDTITVRVVNPFILSIPRDTTVVWNQPLSLTAKTNFPQRTYTYQWTPKNYLNNPDSMTTIATIPKNIGQQFYKLNIQDSYGCKSAAMVAVHIFQTETGFFVPSGFTPNNDGKNDIIRPILLGIKQLDHFMIFNRWGQLIYNTQTPGQGWDGLLHGQLQPSGSTYIYKVSGRDYNDKKIEKSGTIVLIR